MCVCVCTCMCRLYMGEWTCVPVAEVGQTMHVS